MVLKEVLSLLVWTRLKQPKRTILFHSLLNGLNPHLPDGRNFSYITEMTNYTHGQHTVYHHRYHLVWITKYRYRVLRSDIGVRDIIAQVANEMGIKIINGVVSADHLHLFVSIPPHIAVSDFVKKAKGRSSRKIQQAFPQLRKKYWGRRFWGHGYFSTTSGNVTDETIDHYIDNHIDAHKPENIANFSLE